MYYNKIFDKHNPKETENNTKNEIVKKFQLLLLKNYCKTISQKILSKNFIVKKFHKKFHCNKIPKKDC